MTNTEREQEASKAIEALRAEVEAYQENPDAVEPPDALHVVPLSGVEVLLTYGGPSIRLTLFGTADGASTWGSMEYADASGSATVELSDQEAGTFWNYYAPEVA